MLITLKLYHKKTDFWSLLFYKYNPTPPPLAHPLAKGRKESVLLLPLVLKGEMSRCTLSGQRGFNSSYLSPF